jgi:hypothetical protein
VKTKALELIQKLLKNETLDYEDRTFLLGFIMFSLEFQDYVKGTKTNG